MTFGRVLFRFRKTKGWNMVAFGFLLLLGCQGYSQQILWTKLYPLTKADYIFCITQDEDHNMYVGGETQRNAISVPPFSYAKAMVIKLDPFGDTVFVKDLGMEGRVSSIVVDPYGIIRANVIQKQSTVVSYHTIFVSMLSNGFILKQDTISDWWVPSSCIIGKDSSLIVAGQMYRTGSTGTSMFFLRIHKDGIFEPILELNPGHPNCGANRVEQLPNGHYLVSGYVGSKVASYELDEVGANPVFKQWYQTPDLSNFTSGHVSRINAQRYMVGGQGNPSVVGQYDSLLSKFWMKKDEGNQIPPQALIDGSVAVGYRSGIPPYQTFFRIGLDSHYVWNIAFRDSLLARGFFGNVDLTCFSFFADESAIVGGMYDNGSGITDEDPFFIKISNVGTPVTSLSKPKKGTLTNETLAPWPNPTGGTLYLKQHFDKAEVHVYTIAGKEVGSYLMRFGQPIDISNYESGMYLYRAVIDGKGFSGKVIKR